MIVGLRTLTVIAVTAAAVALCVGTTLVRWDELGELSAATSVALGALAAVAVGLAGLGGLDGGSKVGLDLRGRRLVFAARDVRRGAVLAARDLPGWLLRCMLFASFALLGVGALGNHGVERLRALAAESPPTGRCKPPLAAAVVEEEPEAPPPPPVDQAGCALVRRAFALGYAKSLGTCAPQAAAPTRKPTTPVALQPERCERRQVDEPFLHFAWRRWALVARYLEGVRPVAGTAAQVDEVSTRLSWFDSLTATSRHALGGTPHAAHHLWLSLPAPRDEGWRWLRQPEHRSCEERYVHLPLWRQWRPGQESALVEHALGQLLFASRFGTTTSCANYRMHWGAAEDACQRLLEAPERFLREQGAWDDLADVLDRRRRQLELRALAARLGHPAPAEPPPASAVVSLQCVVAEPGRTEPLVSGRQVVLGGQRVGVRVLRLPPIRVEQDGPIDVIAGLAQLLAGAQPGAVDADALAASALAQVPSSPPELADASIATAPVRADASESPDPQLAGPGFPLTRLETLGESDPFAGARWPLRRADLGEIYPYQRVLAAYIDGFRRRYLAQRGRL